MLVESEEMKKDMKQLAFPPLEGDVAPSALIPKACQSLQKQVNKMQTMIDTCESAARLTPLQTKRLALISLARAC